MDNVTVTQEDRETAAKCHEKSCYEIVRIQGAQCRNGYADGDYLVQAFARHRQAALATALAEREGERAEIARLTEELRKAKQAHWFYFADDCSSDRCRDSIDQCIEEDFEWDNKPIGDHVLLISGARPVPDMWVALHYYTDAEKDARESDDAYRYTVHASEEEARATLSGETQ